ncbi:outer membrane protein assembly factor BamB family protein [Natrarchaeobaculum sulfurireducens]|nr:PQQ-binding-like beta-propeller repeat protein [Natrarchaeobaculum sulfurireducens]
MNRYHGYVSGEFEKDILEVQTWNTDSRSIRAPPITSQTNTFLIDGSEGVVTFGTDGQYERTFDYVLPIGAAYIDDDLFVLGSEKLVRLSDNEVSWSVPLEVPPQSIKATGDQILVTPDLADSIVSIHNADTGEIVTTTSVDGTISSAAFSENGTGYLLTSRGTVIAISGDQVAVLADLDTYGTQISVEKDILYVAGNDGNGLITALDIETGEILWEITEPGLGDWGFAVDDRHVYTLTNSGTLTAISEGEIIWTAKSEGSFQKHAGADRAPVCTDDFVMYIGSEMALVVVDRETGTEQGRYTWNPVSPNRPIPYGNGVLLSDQVGLYWLPVDD